MAESSPTAPTSPPSSTSIRRVVLVGHCGYDSGSLKDLARRALPDAEVLRVNRQSDLDAATGPDALLLINRQLDGSFDAADSRAMIQHLAGGPDAPRIMLVSNYPDAQAAAVEAGALPGFGKNDLADPDLIQRLKGL